MIDVFKIKSRQSFLEWWPGMSGSLVRAYVETSDKFMDLVEHVVNSFSLCNMTINRSLVKELSVDIIRSSQWSSGSWKSIGSDLLPNQFYDLKYNDKKLDWMYVEPLRKKALTTIETSSSTVYLFSDINNLDKDGRNSLMDWWLDRWRFCYQLDSGGGGCMPIYSDTRYGTLLLAQRISVKMLSMFSDLDVFCSKTQFNSSLIVSGLVNQSWRVVMNSIPYYIYTDETSGFLPRSNYRIMFAYNNESKFLQDDKLQMTYELSINGNPLYRVIPLGKRDDMNNARDALLSSSDKTKSLEERIEI